MLMEIYVQCDLLCMMGKKVEKPLKCNHVIK